MRDLLKLSFAELFPDLPFHKIDLVLIPFIRTTLTTGVQIRSGGKGDVTNIDPAVGVQMAPEFLQKYDLCSVVQ